MGVTGNELTRRLRKLAHRRATAFRITETRGKGSHGTVYLGERRTTIKDRRKEIGEGLLIAMLRDLGLTKKDII